MRVDVRRIAPWWCTAALVIAAPPTGAHTCGTASVGDCAANADTTCRVACSEADLRTAVAVVNACGGHRTITFDFGAGGTSCTIPMSNTTGTASCGDFANAICLTGTYITIDGTSSQGALGPTFQYVGKYICASCRGECAGPQPALFVVRGNHNRVRNVGLQFFPEGVHLEGGDQNGLEGISAQYYCEDALTVDGGTNHTIQGSSLTGATDPEASGASGGPCWKERSTAPPAQAIACTTDSDCHGACSTTKTNCMLDTDCPAGETCAQFPGQRCHCGNGLFASDPANGGSCAPAASGTCYRKALCGLDKAIQVTSATSLLISNNHFTNSLTPILVSDALGPADAEVRGNQVTGSQVDLILSTEPNFAIRASAACEGPAATGPTSTARFQGNTVQYCKFGVRSLNGAVVHATLNTVMHDYVSGFEVEGPSTLTGSLNRMKDNGTLPATENDPQRGSLLVLDDVNARVDFGSRVSGGEAGLNVFCGQRGDIWDKVAPCTAQCCGATVLAQRNCFETGTNIVDPYGRVDFGDHGRVGLEPPCTDYQLTCDF